LPEHDVIDLSVGVSLVTWLAFKVVV
jgi:hypothetical protein